MRREVRFRVVLYRDADAFLRRIDEKASRKIKDNIYKASLCLDPVLLKKLTGEIWEFRTLHAKTQYRLLAFWDKQEYSNTLVIATHGFVKKTGKTPKKEIDKAMKIMKLYFDSK